MKYLMCNNYGSDFNAFKVYKQMRMYDLKTSKGTVWKPLILFVIILPYCTLGKYNDNSHTANGLSVGVT